MLQVSRMALVRGCVGAAWYAEPWGCVRAAEGRGPVNGEAGSQLLLGTWEPQRGLRSTPLWV